MNIEAFREEILSNKRKKVILDTDAYNEIDDQFCIAYLMKRTEEIELLSINAAPFFNENSTSAGDGMEKSYWEIFKIRDLTDPQSTIPVYRGSQNFLKDRNTAEESDACESIIKTVMESEERITIIAIGAITNVASAIIKCPEIAQRASVIWLGGHATHLRDGRVEFNLRGDIPAAQVVFDSGIDLVQIPCRGVCSVLSTTSHELEYYLRGKNAVCDYLVDNVVDVTRGKYAKSRVIWDVSAAAVILAKDSYRMEIRPRPRICDDGIYDLTAEGALYLYVAEITRDAMLGDLFRTLTDER